MRIIAGRWRGRVLEAPRGRGTRPTADRVRETLFSMLASRLGSFEDLRVADLFAGSGALGFEALSRGAAQASFVENDSKAAAIIRANAEKLGAQIQLLAGSALALPQLFDLRRREDGTHGVEQSRICGEIRARCSSDRLLIDPHRTPH